MTLLVGTASWTDKTLLESGRFYPESAKSPEARLRFYASQFNLVEVDTSYYAIPSVTTAQHWAERTPPGFVFNVKAFSLFTGQWTSTDVLPSGLEVCVEINSQSSFVPHRPCELYRAACGKRKPQSALSHV